MAAASIACRRLLVGEVLLQDSRCVLQRRLLRPSLTLVGPQQHVRNLHSHTRTTSVGASATATAPSKEQQHQKNKKFTTLNEGTPFQLCFLRHGQSTWNRDNRFIGWTDTPLTDDGVLEARVAGQMLHNAGLRFDEVHTSLLRRSIRTTNLVLMELHQEYIPVHKHWRLNERHYGDLVGKHKKEAVKQFGKDQVKRWRRSYDEPPPPMSLDHPYHPSRDPRYRHMVGDIPFSESLKDTVARSSVYWDEVLAPALKEGKTVLVVGHENNLRSLLMRLEGISETDILHLNLPRAVPLAYQLDENLKPLGRADGKRDEATGFLRGEWVGGSKAVQEILDRDYKQVYDTTITQNLEIGETRNKWNTWMEFLVGKPSPYQKATSGGSANEDPSFLNTPPVPALELDPLEDCSHKPIASMSTSDEAGGARDSRENDEDQDVRAAA